MTVHVTEELAEGIGLNNGIGVEQKEIAALGLGNTAVITFGIAQILVAGHDPNLRKVLLHHLHTAIRRGTIDHDDFASEVGSGVASG